MTVKSIDDTIKLGRHLRQMDFWNDVHRSGGASMHEFAEYLNKKYVDKNRKVLEIGCSDMSLTSPYENRDKLFVGVDIIIEALIAARHNLRSGKFIVASATQLPFLNNSFDIATSFDIISSLGEEAPIAISEMARVAKKIIFTVAHEDAFLESLRNEHKFDPKDFKYGKLLPTVYGIELLFFTEGSLMKLLKDQNLEVMQFKVFNERDCFDVDSDLKSRILVVARSSN